MAFMASGHYPSLVADLWDFARAVLRHWIAGVTGGIIAAALSLAGIFHPLPKNIIAAVLIGYVLVAAFYAWREEHKKAKGKPRQEILTKITDEFHRVQIPGDPNYDWIGLLVKHSSDFGDWRDLDWVCGKLSEQHSDPFFFFSVKYTPKSFGEKKRFKFINDARTAHFDGHPIFTDKHAVDYMEVVWADQNKLATTKERTLRSIFFAD